MVYPPAIMPRMFFSMMRVPRIVGLPPQIAGSTLTRSSICAPPSSGTGPHLPSFDAAYQVFQQSVLLAIRSLCAPAVSTIFVVLALVLIIALDRLIGLVRIG